MQSRCDPLYSGDAPPVRARIAIPGGWQDFSIALPSWSGNSSPTYTISKRKRRLMKKLLPRTILDVSKSASSQSPAPDNYNVSDPLLFVTGLLV